MTDSTAQLLIASLQVSTHTNVYAVHMVCIVVAVALFVAGVHDGRSRW